MGLQNVRCEKCGGVGMMPDTCVDCKGKGKVKSRFGIKPRGVQKNVASHVGCKRCRGSGKDPLNKRLCTRCQGKGEYDPNEESFDNDPDPPKS